MPSRDLLALWRAGSQTAANIFWDRYHVRLVALVAARLNSRYRNRIAPEDVVQSAMGSFFRATSAGSKPSIELDSAASAWNILATFARRKLSRVLELESALKRGRGWEREPLETIESKLFNQPSTLAADELLADLDLLLTPEEKQLLELLLENATQREIAERLKVDERTVRRHIAAMREFLNGHLADESSEEPRVVADEFSITIPNITYREFVLGKMVGRGALGKVYRARLQSDGQIVAVKFMHRHLWTNPASQSSFLREIEHASGINHRGILKYLGWGQSPHGGPYLVSEYIDGVSLTGVERDNPTTAVLWLIQVCEAMQAAHEAGVVHGDLTPNNVLIAHDGRVVITDFGFSTGLQQSSAPLGGTLGYAAPEQISTSLGLIGPTTDIYAIGGLAHFLLMGVGPHQGKANALLDTVSDKDVVIEMPLSAAERKLADVARMALKKAVNSRVQSVGALLEVLRC